MLGAVAFALCGCEQPKVQVEDWRAPLPVEWFRPTEGPCISLGEEGAFDSDHLFAPCVFEHGGGYRMLYSGSGPQEGRLFRIGIADSKDGLTWTKLDANPVLGFGDGKTSLVTPALVRCFGGSVWPDGPMRMYVIAVDFTGDQVHRLYTTTSTDDGLTWSKLEGPLMEDVYAPSIVLTAREPYRMWYTDVSAEPWCIRLAVSDDGLAWSPADPDPVLVVDQPWEKQNLFYPYVIPDLYHPGSGLHRYLMWYGSYWSAQRNHTAIGLAVSDDGIRWHKYADNPIIRPDPDRPFESNYCTSHSVLPVQLQLSADDKSWFPKLKLPIGYQIWYATRNKDARKHKYFAIGTAGWISFLDQMCIQEWPIVKPPEFSMSAERANDARLEPLHYLERYDRELVPSHAFTAQTREAWKEWHAGLRERLADVIGLQHMDLSQKPGTEPRPLRVVKGPVDQLEGYTRHAFTIETAPGLWVPAFLLVPEGLATPRPAILCSHGHGIGMNDLVGLAEDGSERPFGEGYQHDFALQAVKAGFVALAFEQCGFGRRRDIDFHKKHNMWNNCEQPSKNALHYGLCMTGIRVWDAMRMIDFLQTRTEVQPDRIGMAGISGGGLVTQFTAALDDRIRAACVSGYCNRYADCILAIHHCIDNYVPGLGRLADNDDVACLIAPRPLLIESGTKDHIFPIAATRAALRKLRKCYRLLDASGMLDADIFEGEHEFSGAKTWAFFARHLGEPK